MQGIKAKQSATDYLYTIMMASKSTQKNQEIYHLIGQFAVMAAAISKTEMTPSGHVFPDRVSDIAAHFTTKTVLCPWLPYKNDWIYNFKLFIHSKLF